MNEVVSLNPYPSRLEDFDNLIYSIIKKNKIENFRVIDLERSLSKEQLTEVEKLHEKTLESLWPFFTYKDKAEKTLKRLVLRKLLKRGSDYTRYSLL